MSGMFPSGKQVGRGGFTLIELLVVIAIISLLVSMLLPSLTQAREQARTTVCLTNQHAIGTAIHTYAQEYNDFLPPALRQDPEQTPAPPSDSSDPWVRDITHSESWATILVREGLIDAPRPRSPYDMDDTPSPFRCPSGRADVSPLSNSRGSASGDPRAKAWQGGLPQACTIDDEDWYVHNWYGASADTFYVKNFPFAKVPRDTDPDYSFGYQLGKLRSTSRIAAIYDGWNVHRGWAWYTIAARHGGRKLTNVMRLDGSAKTYERTALPLERFEKNRYMTATELSESYPALMWRNDQWEN
ncbi:MAG: DUF1559 domain-containing protein [Phycisphaerae bacterium]